jgi:hypothetical protein
MGIQGFHLSKNGTMQILRIGSPSSAKGPVEYCTGAVRVDPVFPGG